MKRSILQVLFAQGIVLVASVLKSLVLPIVLDVEGFAYWQVYVLYSGFVGVFALGYSDGVYLKYGGCDYNELPFERLRSSIRFYTLSLLAFSAIVCCFSLFEGNQSRAFSLFFVGVDVLLSCLSGLLLYVLQITNQIKSYSIFVTVDKIAMIGLIGIIIVAFPQPSFYVVVIADVITKALVCVALVVRLRGLFFGPSDSLRDGARAYLSEARVGFSLLIANLAGMLAVNAGRFMVELFDSAANYAYYSFGVTVTNLVLTFVSATALVLYPNLKRMNFDSAVVFFDKVDSVSLKVMSVGLMLYAPCVVFVIWVIPKYEPMLVYLGFLFLSVVGQTKMQLLNNTYYKALRKERRMLFVNAQAIAIFLVIASVSYSITGSVTAIAACTAIVLLYRAWTSEFELRKDLGIPRFLKIVFEVAICLAFAVASMISDYAISLGLTEVIGAIGFAAAYFYGRRIS